LVASAEEREKLARAAARLNARIDPALRLPALILMTDQVRLPDPLPAVRALPEGGAIIVRHTNDAARRKLAEALLPIARERNLRLLVANDRALAERIGADGLHLSEAAIEGAGAVRPLHPAWLITAATHSEAAVELAGEVHADAALLSPVFPTLSHLGRPALGPKRFMRIARRSPIPVYALGGITAANAALLDGPNVAGIAAIGALAPG
jgi:thiamine-phosphate pyrophosphorylase